MKASVQMRTAKMASVSFATDYKVLNNCSPVKPTNRIVELSSCSFCSASRKAQPMTIRLEHSGS